MHARRILHGWALLHDMTVFTFVWRTLENPQEYLVEITTVPQSLWQCALSVNAKTQNVLPGHEEL